MKTIRRAITQIEILVVIVIIGVLLGLLVPAVQRVRAASLRVSCMNNMKQIALALHHYHDTYGRFPSGLQFQGGEAKYRYLGWLPYLLPYIGQEGLWLETEQAFTTDPLFCDNPPHVGFATIVPTFGCPSDSRCRSPQLSKDGFRVALSSYLGLSGSNYINNDGVLFRDSLVRLAEITDGTSNTLMVGERPPSDNFQFGWWYGGVGQLGTGSCDTILGVREMNAAFHADSECGPGPFHFEEGTLGDMCDMYHFWSLHAGGANFAFADCSVHFMAYESDPILPALASRAGGEVVELP
jgi:prepilin-type processing-associated H-X9-DG protein